MSIHVIRWTCLRCSSDSGLPTSFPPSPLLDEVKESLAALPTAIELHITSWHVGDSCFGTRLYVSLAREAIDRLALAGSLLLWRFLRSLLHRCCPSGHTHDLCTSQATDNSSHQQRIRQRVGCTDVLTQVRYALSYGTSASGSSVCCFHLLLVPFLSIPFHSGA
jgi:hypothetical protein